MSTALGERVGRKKGLKRTAGKQIGLRLSKELNERLEAVSSGLQIDISALIRMLLVEHLWEYEQRLEEAKGRGPEESSP